MAQAETELSIPKAFQKWAKKNGCPAFRGTQIFKDLLVKFWEENEETWRDDEGEVEGTQAEYNRERIKMLRKQQRKADREHEMAMGRLVQIDTVRDSLGAIMAALTAILKKTLTREDYNAVSKQFQKVDFKGYLK